MSAWARARVANSQRSSAMRRSSTQPSPTAVASPGSAGGFDTAAAATVVGRRDLARGRPALDRGARWRSMPRPPSALGRLRSRLGSVAGGGGVAASAVGLVVGRRSVGPVGPVVIAFMTGSSPLEIGMPTSAAFGSSGSDPGRPVSGSAGSMIRPGTGRPSSRTIGIAPGIGPGLAPRGGTAESPSARSRPDRPSSSPGQNRTFVRRSGVPDGSGDPIEPAIGGPATGRFWSRGREGIVGQGGPAARDRIVRNGQPDLAWRGRPSTNELDDGGAADEAEDEAECQEAEFARRHAVRIPRLVLLRLRGTMAGTRHPWPAPA